jgi:adenylate kinase
LEGSNTISGPAGEIHSSKRAVIVGIPGVGKTTVIARASEILSQKKRSRTVVFGTLMFEEAKKTLGIKDRDEMRRLPVETQRRLQENAAQRISEMDEEVVIVDTHLFISTGEGYYPGLPMRLLNVMKPTNLIMVAATPYEIAGRRKNDQTRKRDSASPAEIQGDLEVSKSMIASCSVLTGAPFAVVMNSENGVEHAARQIARILGDGMK